MYTIHNGHAYCNNNVLSCTSINQVDWLYFSHYTQHINSIHTVWNIWKTNFMLLVIFIALPLDIFTLMFLFISRRALSLFISTLISLIEYLTWRFTTMLKISRLNIIDLAPLEGRQKSNFSTRLHGNLLRKRTI